MAERRIRALSGVRKVAEGRTCVKRVAEGRIWVRRMTEGRICALSGQKGVRGVKRGVTKLKST